MPLITLFKNAQQLRKN
ncbi:hypothetical protein FFH90_018060 [Pseudomonas sp. ATCC 43928]|nr:hypothetical protein FFH90_018060 [Pseudomonas sp. ATCC 43928]